LDNGVSHPKLRVDLDWMRVTDRKGFGDMDIAFPLNFALVHIYLNRSLVSIHDWNLDRVTDRIGTESYVCHLTLGGQVADFNFLVKMIALMIPKFPEARFAEIFKLS
jgi:hypothetical protein